MSTFFNCHVVGPFSQIHQVDVPSPNGFLLNPSDSNTSPGWGFPIYPDDDSTKPRIFPGTYGADGQKCILRKLKGEWKESKDKRKQSVGNISWWGPAIPTLSPEALAAYTAAEIVYTTAKRAAEDALEKYVVDDNKVIVGEENVTLAIAAHEKAILDEETARGRFVNLGGPLYEAEYIVAQATTIARAADVVAAEEALSAARASIVKSSAEKQVADAALSSATTLRDTALGKSKRNVLSYHGPAARLFPTEFAYDAAGIHTRVYMQGGILGIAPGGVLGASLTRMTNDEKAKNKVDYWLNVIYLISGKTKVARRPLSPVLIESALTDADISAMKGLYNSKDNPTGWVALGDVDTEGFDTPRRPWFFNESGDKASSLYSKDKSFVPCADEPEITQKEWTLFRVTIAGGGATSSTSPPLAMYKAVATGSITQLPDFVTPADPTGRVHTFEEIQMSSEMVTTGEQIVAVDYVKDEEVLVKLKIQATEGFTRDFMRGIDPAQYGLDGVPNNIDKYLNDLYLDSDGLPLGAIKPIQAGSHVALLYYRGSIFCKLVFTIDKKEYYALTEMYYVAHRNPVTRMMTARGYMQANIRFLDIRLPIAFFYLLEEESNTTVQPFKTYYKKSEIVVTNFRQEFKEEEGEDAYVYEVIATNGYSNVQTTLLTEQPLLADTYTAYNAALAEVGAGTWTWRSLTGERPTLNDDNHKYKYGSMYHLEPNAASFPIECLGLRGTMTLTHDYHVDTQGVATLPTGEYVANMYVPDPASNTGEPTLLTKCSTGIDAVTLSGGKKLYPLGTI